MSKVINISKSQDADELIQQHNVNGTAHNDIRTALAGKENAGAANAVQANLTSHINDKNNSHNVTAEQVSYTPMPNGNITETKVESALHQVDTYATGMLSIINGHIENKNNPHGMTAAQLGLGNVENKSSATIRGELTKTDVTNALGYTPPTTNTTYSQATNSTLGLVKIGYTESGKNYPVELNSSGQMYVNVPWTDTNTTYTLGSFGITATAAELNKLDGATVTVAEINYLDGVTSNVQTQLNGKLSTEGGTLTGNLTGKYITGTWLQSTANNHLNSATAKICVQDQDGWVYHRTPAEILNDIGVPTAIQTAIGNAISASY